MIPSRAPFSIKSSATAGVQGAKAGGQAMNRFTEEKHDLTLATLRIAAAQALADSERSTEAELGRQVLGAIAGAGPGGRSACPQ